MKLQIIAAFLGMTLAAAQVPTEGTYKLVSTQFEAIGDKCRTTDDIKWRFLLVDEPTDRESPEFIRYMQNLVSGKSYRLKMERPRAASTFFGDAPCGGLGPQLYCRFGLYLTPSASSGVYFYSNPVAPGQNRTDGMGIRFVDNETLALSWVFDGCVMKNTAVLEVQGQPTEITNFLKFDKECNVIQETNLVYEKDQLDLLRANFDCVPESIKTRTSTAITTTTRQTTSSTKTQSPTSTSTPSPTNCPTSDPYCQNSAATNPTGLGGLFISAILGALCMVF